MRDVRCGMRPIKDDLTVTKHSTLTITVVCLLLIAVTLVVYYQTGNHTFFILDANDHVTENVHVEGGVTAENIVWAFTSVAAFNWHPVTWLSHMTVAELYGMDPRAHHLANVIIHTVSSVFLLLLFLRLTGMLWQSLFVAALFALHPLHVESVVWVAERKDVLSALFCFLTLYSYTEYVAKNLKPTLYILTLFFFILGLMSKSMLVTLPIIMLLIDYWPLGRYRHEERERYLLQSFRQGLILVKEKTPFFACSLATGIITLYAQHKGGATKSFDLVPFTLRIENALTAYVKYIFKILWPLDLGVLYPIPSSFPFWQVIGSLIFLLSVSAAVLYFGHRFPYLAVGWLWFIITLLPVIGFIQVGSQAMADRYTYIPAIGLYIIAAWGGADLAKVLHCGKRSVALIVGVIIAGSAALTWRQIGYWQDSISILRHTLQVTSNNYLVNDLLGIAYAKKGDLDSALEEYRKAVQINSGDATVRSNLGIVFSAKGDLDSAIREFQAALRIKPNDARIHSLLGDVLFEKGDLNAAIHEYQEVLRISPTDSNAQSNLGVVLAKRKTRD